MCNKPVDNKSPVEAWKQITEFSKTIITIATSVLTIIVSYYVTQGINLTILNCISPLFLLISIFLSFYGFGHAIASLDEGTEKPNTRRLSNFGGGFLILGVLAIVFISKEKGSPTTDVLKRIEKSTTSFGIKLPADSCKSFELRNHDYYLQYKIDTQNISVEYCTKDGKIISIK